MTNTSNLTVDARMIPDSTTATATDASEAAAPDTGAIHIRIATDDDADGIIALVADCYAEYAGCVLLVDEEAPDLRQPASAFGRILGNVWVALDETAKDDPKIVGVVAYAPTDAPGMARIHRLFVNARYRGHGIGPRLSALAEDAACTGGADIMMLYTDSRFERAQRMVERYGYHRQKGARRLADASNSLQYTYTKTLG